MRTRLFSTLSLLTILVSACAASKTTEPSSAQLTAPSGVGQPSETLVLEAPSLMAETVPTETVSSTALPVATSRGPNLEATDPLTVSLASGELQFVEFFRFT
jgi:hypothetical protein